MTRITRRHAVSVSSERFVALSVLLVLLVISLFSLGGCASGGPKPAVMELQPFTAEEQAAWNTAKSAEYRVRARDKLRINFKYHPELNQDGILVLPDGRIRLPEVDGTEVAGFTLSQIDSTLTSLYGREYLDPDLTIMMVDFGHVGVYVLGQVQRPGYHLLSVETNSVVHAVAMAGGLTSDASSSEIMLMRVTSEGYVYRHLDLSHMEKREFMTANLMDIQPYDVIYVPRSTVGDIAYFRSTILSSALSITDLFWDVYAITNIDKVDRLVR